MKAWGGPRGLGLGVFLWLWGAGVAMGAEQLLGDFGRATRLQKNKPHCSALPCWEQTALHYCGFVF